MKSILSGFLRFGSIGLLLLFCGYNLHTSVHRFDGIVGMTRKNGFGCYCHNLDPTPSVHVWIEGPERLQPGDTALYTLKLVGDSTRTAGFNIASAFGALQVVDSTWTYWYEGEMTHVVPKPAETGDTISWQFGYVAPPNDGLTIDTLYSVGNSTNQDTMATDADHWNYGDNFLIDVSTVTEANAWTGTTLPSAIVVHQNYPNPFNPVTTIRFEVPREAFVKITLYNVDGREIAVLAGERYPAGAHELFLDANRLALSSSIYFCRFEARQDGSSPVASVVRKIALVR